MSDAPWKLDLRPASYNGAPFYVEIQARGSGFRLVPHEFPKKDIPWLEPMGRRIRHWPITGYLVYSPVNMPDVFGARDALIAALETPGQGSLVLPTGLEQMNDEPPGAVMVDTYTIVERQERGGWCAFEMVFVEAGQMASSQPYADTQGATNAQAQQSLTDFTGTIDQHVAPSGQGGIGSDYVAAGAAAAGATTGTAYSP